MYLAMPVQGDRHPIKAGVLKDSDGVEAKLYQ